MSKTYVYEIGRSAWKRMKRAKCPWGARTEAEEAIVAAIGDQPSPAHFPIRIRPEEPWDTDNMMWITAAEHQKRMKGSDDA